MRTKGSLQLSHLLLKRPEIPINHKNTGHLSHIGLNLYLCVMAKINIKKDAPAQTDKPKPAAMAFGRTNYLIILGGVALLIIGYLLMVGGGSDDPNVFNEEMFSPRRITVSPIVLLIGFVVVLYGIMHKGKTQA